MLTRHLPALLRAAVLSLVLAGPAHAGLKDYPFRVTSQKFDDHTALVAQNDGVATVTAHLDFMGENANADGRWPITVVLPPRTSYALGRVFPVDRAKPAGTRVTSSFQFGDVRAKPEGARYRLPYEIGSAFTISQAFGGRLRTHNTPDSQYAVDFTLPENTPIVAARDGVVVEATFSFRRGGLDPSLKDKANVVSILHDDGTVAQYAHLAAREMPIKRGDRVAAGTMIGYSGDTGFSEGPHLHFAVTKPQVRADGVVTHIAIPMVFYAGDPVVEFEPKEGMRVKATYARGVQPAPAPALAAPSAPEPAPPVAAARPAVDEPAGAASVAPLERSAVAELRLPVEQLPAAAPRSMPEQPVIYAPPPALTPWTPASEPQIVWPVGTIAAGVAVLALVIGGLTLLAPKRVVLAPQSGERPPDWDEK